jgi:hypothetical protein
MRAVIAAEGPRALRTSYSSREVGEIRRRSGSPAREIRTPEPPLNGKNAVMSVPIEAAIAASAESDGTASPVSIWER